MKIEMRLSDESIDKLVIKVADRMLLEIKRMDKGKCECEEAKPEKKEEKLADLAPSELGEKAAKLIADEKKEEVEKEAPVAITLIQMQNAAFETSKKLKGAGPAKVKKMIKAFAGTESGKLSEVAAEDYMKLLKSMINLNQ